MEANLTQERQREIQKENQRAEYRIQLFERQYGSLALQLARYGAFPLVVTSELLYCLREQFVPECPWYHVGDILLSGLCNTIGYDLYEMQGSTRNLLLKNFSKPDLSELQKFMTTYIQERINLLTTRLSKHHSDWIQWTALACLEPTQAKQEIEKKLKEIALTDPKDRFHWAVLVEGFADFLLLEGFYPLLMDHARSVYQSQPILTAEERLIKDLQIQIQPFTFQTERLKIIEDQLQSAEIDLITVDPYGKRNPLTKSTVYFLLNI